MGYMFKEGKGREMREEEEEEGGGRLIIRDEGVGKSSPVIH